MPVGYDDNGQTIVVKQSAVHDKKTDDEHEHERLARLIIESTRVGSNE
jgi:hypothetical protein